jgi:hypothetical protein
VQVVEIERYHAAILFIYKINGYPRHLVFFLTWQSAYHEASKREEAVYPRFEIEPAQNETCPRAAVSNNDVWDLVEYLAIQRVMVTYTYSADRFIVTFPHLDHEAACRLLDEWEESYLREHEDDRFVERAAKQAPSFTRKKLPRKVAQLALGSDAEESSNCSIPSSDHGRTVPAC